jgi:hypothetical protein
MCLLHRRDVVVEKTGSREVDHSEPVDQLDAHVRVSEGYKLLCLLFIIKRVVGRAVPCRAVPCRVVSCRVVSCRVVSCRGSAK